MKRKVHYVDHAVDYVVNLVNFMFYVFNYMFYAVNFKFYVIYCIIFTSSSLIAHRQEDDSCMECELKHVVESYTKRTD